MNDGESLSFRDNFNSLASTLTSSHIKVGAVNCDSEPKLCKSKSLPTFQLQARNQIKKFIPNEENELTSRSLYDFISDNLPSDIVNIRLTNQIDEFVNKTIAKKVKTESYWNIGLILLTSKYETSLFYRVLSSYYHGKVMLAEVRGSNDQIKEYLDLQSYSYPILIGICGGGNRYAYEVYNDKDMKNLKKIDAFVNKLKPSSYCSNLQSLGMKKEKKRNHQIEEEKLAVLGKTETELKAMKVSELKSFCQILNIGTTNFLEKNDYIHAILAMKNQLKSRNSNKKSSFSFWN
jgi:hypothetical protein